jgi:hypothetical protein
VKQYSLAFKRLPGELNEAILAQLPDLQSLERAARSCHSLYHAANSAKDQIATSIVYRMVGPGLLPDALMTVATSDILSGTDLYMKGLKEGSWTSTIPGSLPFSATVHLSKLHSAIEHFVERYQAIGRDALQAEGAWVGSNLYVGSNLNVYADKELSRMERLRFERAFYRFETCRNMVVKHCSAASWDIEIVTSRSCEFFDRYAMHELEQVICVIHFLGYGVVAPGELHERLSFYAKTMLLTCRGQACSSPASATSNGPSFSSSQ